MNTESFIVVPESTVLRLEPKNKYGSLPDLDDEELANPEELERCVLRAEWEPVLSLPRPELKCLMRPSVDMDGDVDWGAFGTVDFDRRRPQRDRDRSKAVELGEKLKETLIILSIVKDRLPGMAKYRVLEYLRCGILELEHVENDDMRALAQLDRKARKLQREIGQLVQRSRERKQRELEAWLRA